MSGPPPPPPPPGPPPPPAPAAKLARPAPGKQPERGALLSSIQQGAKLKKTTTVDKSGPLVGGGGASSGSSAAPSSGGGGGSSSSSSGPPAGAPQLAGIFAGGFPQLKKTGREGAASMVGKGPPSRQASAPAPLRTSPAPAAPKKTQSNPALKKTPPVRKMAAPPPKTSSPARGSPVVIPRKVSPRQTEPAAELVIALYDYTAVKGGELSFKKHDTLAVLEKKPSGWWKCRGESGMCLGQTGLAPGNYTAPLKRCKAKYAYKAAQSDELSFQKGDVITVKKEGKNWWIGELNGAVGAFPVTYTNVLF